MRASSLLLLPLLWAAALAQPRPLDTTHSSFTVYVDKSGFFSHFAHNHEIRAPISAGLADEQAHTIQFTIRAAELKVLDPDVSDKERAEVQDTMVGPKVLDVARFPEIRFVSTRIEPAGAQEQGSFGWVVHGNLTLHGQTRPVVVRVFGSEGSYRGTAALKQTEYDIKPITLAGGTVKVKDEVRIQFQIQMAAK